MRYAYGVTSALLLGGAALSLVTGLPAGAQVAQNDTQAIEGIVPRAGAPVSFADLTQQLQPAVVNIAVRQKVVVKPQQNPFGGIMFGRAAQPQEKLAEAVGSGFIISADGYIVTNNHVISLDNENAADGVTVKLADGNQYNARIVGRDPESDIAVLKVDAKTPLPFVPFGDSDKVRAGDWVIAIGNPFGLGGTVTSGIISSVNRNTGTGAYDHYIQTDASINSGNSGGPMFDMRGNVIGINNWIVAPGGGNIGIGFAIPSAVAKPIVEKLVSGRMIERGFLGVQIQPVTDEIADSIGLPHDSGEVVRGVQPGLPGAAAGLKVGDIVLKVNNESVTPSRTLSAIVSDTAPGTRIPLDVLREGKQTRLWAVVAKRPSQKELATSLTPATPRSPYAASQPADLVGSALGLKVTDMLPEYADELGVPPNTQGVVVVDVASASDAANRGLGRGAIVTGANFGPIRSVADLEKAVAEARKQGRTSITLQITGPAAQGGTIYLALRLS